MLDLLEIPEILLEKKPKQKPQKSTLGQEIITYYEVAGPDYAEWSKDFNMHFGYFKWGMNPFFLEPMLNQMNEEVLKKLQIPKNTSLKAIDMGCGMGTVARYFARKHLLLKIKALTIVPWQVEQGKQLTKEAGLENQVEILEADYMQMPFADASIDFAYALESSCYAKGASKKPLISEMARVLKEDSRFVVADFFVKKKGKLPWLIQKIYDKTCKYWALPGFGEINAFKETLEKSGFTEIEIKDISWNVAPSVGYVPKTTLKFLIKEIWKNKSLKLEKERWNNALAPILGIILGLCRPYFSYYLISGRKI